jgi:hypothetical protein
MLGDPAFTPALPGEFTARHVSVAIDAITLDGERDERESPTASTCGSRESGRRRSSTRGSVAKPDPRGSPSRSPPNRHPATAALRGRRKPRIPAKLMPLVDANGGCG